MGKITEGPCYGCEKRFVGCHSTCLDYMDYRQKMEVYNAKKNAYYKEQADHAKYIVEARRRMKNGYRKRS